MKISLFVSVIMILSCPLFPQTNNPDSLSIKKESRYIDFGHSISLGPEYLALKPDLYGANLNYRFWYSTGTKKRHTDHIINVSAGYLRLMNENTLKLKAGDMVLLKRLRSSYNNLRLGVFADYFAGHSTQLLSLDCHLGLQTDRFYFYVGGIQPIVKTKNDKNISTQLSIGFDFYIIDRKAYYN